MIWRIRSSIFRTLVCKGDEAAYFALILLFLFPMSGSYAQPLHTFTVTNTSDQGSGSLRNAILQANDTPGPDLIRFDAVSGTFNDPTTIRLTSPLPEILDDLEINGFIDGRLWKATGVTISGEAHFPLFHVPEKKSLTLRYLTLSGGKARAGAALQNHGKTVLANMLLLDNLAQDGGAIAQSGGELWVINSTLINNKASEKGGAIYIAGGKTQLTHVTITTNQAPIGSGLFNRGELHIANSIIADNTHGEDCYSDTVLQEPSPHNLIRRHRRCGSPLIRSDPMLGKLNYYNGPTRSLPLTGRSPAINFGDNSASVDENGDRLRWDQRGNGDPRDAIGIVDIGAFEQQPMVNLLVDTKKDLDLRFCTSAPADCSLRGAIMLVNASDRHNRIGFDHGLFNGQTIALEYPSPLPPVTQPLELFSDDGTQVIIDLGKGKDAFLGNNIIKLKNVIIK